MTQVETTPSRLARLEARVDALEGRPAPTPETVDDGRFWALEGLRSAELEPAVVYSGIVDLPAGGIAEWQMGRRANDLLDTDWGAGVLALSALGHPVRLALLQHVLRAEARTAAELTALEGIGTTGQVYHHLRQLVAAGWLRTGARGLHEVPVERVVPLLTILAAAGV